MIAGRFRALRSAVGWAYDERIIDHHPIRNMRGPGRMEPRRPLTDSDLRSVLWTAEANLLAAVANDDGRPRSDQRRRLAEQELLLVRLAANSGARRGEIAALQFADLDGRVLRIERSLSAELLSTTKSGRARTLTPGVVHRDALEAARSRVASASSARTARRLGVRGRRRTPPSAQRRRARPPLHDYTSALQMLMPWEVFAPSIPLIRQATGDGFAELTRRIPELAGVSRRPRP